jgi:hypothetical protein
LQADQLLRKRSHPIDVTAGPSKVHLHVAANSPTKARKRLRERRDPGLQHGIVLVARSRHEHADAPHPLPLLRACGKRPRRRRAAGERNEVAPVGHSITSLASAYRVGGTVMPRAFAVFRFRNSSTLVDCCTGRSARIEANQTQIIVKVTAVAHQVATGYEIAIDQYRRDAVADRKRAQLFAPAKKVRICFYDKSASPPACPVPTATSTDTRWRTNSSANVGSRS